MSLRSWKGGMECVGGGERDPKIFMGVLMGLGGGLGGSLRSWKGNMERVWGSEGNPKSL